VPPQTAHLVKIAAGDYVPLYLDAAEKKKAIKKRHVPAFDIDTHAVTNGDFLKFVKAHPEWRRSQIKRLFAEAKYLSHWSGDLKVSQKILQSPVVNVSWFAALAFCEARGRTLPTVDQWEFVAIRGEDTGKGEDVEAVRSRLREWYAQPTPNVLKPVGSVYKNSLGVYDMHGLIWEWTLDFNSSIVTGESRGDSGLERSLFCGSGAAGATDFKDYAAFMRYAFRSSLQASYTVANLGFRCVSESKGD
jgi:formylglycine-generating enzyme required for sulfatase activity